MLHAHAYVRAEESCRWRRIIQEVERKGATSCPTNYSISSIERTRLCNKSIESDSASQHPLEFDVFRSRTTVAPERRHRYNLRRGNVGLLELAENRGHKDTFTAIR